MHVASALERVITYLDLPAPFSTLPPVIASLNSWSPAAFLAATDDPRHLPLATTLAIIPTVWVLGHISSNVSWVDRIWTTFPLLTTCMIIAWVGINDKGTEFAACLPRLFLLLALQTIWSMRLTYHTARRGLYELQSEDYRYIVIRKLIPGWVFELIHIFMVAIAQPMLLWALSLPIAALVIPAGQLSEGPLPDYVLRFGAVSAFLPERFQGSGANLPVLHAADAFFSLCTLSAVALEAAGDNAMYAFQTAKHAIMDRASRLNTNGNGANGNGAGDNVHSNKSNKGIGKPSLSRVPTPVSCPPAFYPGFPIRGLHSWVRHPNFAGEQSFWLSQAFFAINASTAPNIEVCLAPAFMVSLLFCASTALTEWITTRKYPIYRAYSRLVGQFLPMETVLKWMWTAMTGSWPKLEAEVYKRGSALYAEAAAQGEKLDAEELSASNLRVGDRVVTLVPSEKKTS